MRRIRQIILLFTLISLTAFNTIEKKPTVLLFMLHQSTQKIEILKSQNKSKIAETIRLEDENLNQSIMQDFNLFFKYCPVLFFYNSDYDAVKEKRWNDVHFLKNTGNENFIMNASIDNYLIGEVNYTPSPQYHDLNNPKPKAESVADGGYANSNDPYGIILYDEQFELLPSKLVYTNANTKKISSKPKKIIFMGAEKLNSKLSKFFN